MKILVISTDSMMYLFLMKHVKMFQESGYQVDVAISFLPEFSDQSYGYKIKEFLPKSTVHKLNISRSPLSLKNLRSIFAIKNIIKNNDYDLIITNEPSISAVARLSRLILFSFYPKFIYVAHGLHFFKGGPLFNYFFYLIELPLSVLTSRIVLINRTDLEFAKKYFLSPSSYIPGIGFNHQYFSGVSCNNPYSKYVVRSEFIILSVGELNDNKNHRTILKSLSILSDLKFKYFICGVGYNRAKLEALANSLGLRDKVVFLGQRDDMINLYANADIFVHPSHREGLGIAPIEAMAAGLPIVTSDKHGLKDFSVNELTGFTCDPNDYKCFALAIKTLYENRDGLRARISQYNKVASKAFDFSNSHKALSQIVQKVLSS